MNEASFYIHARGLSGESLRSLATRLRKSSCECDDYHGYRCGKHWRLSMVEHLIDTETSTDAERIGKNSPARNPIEQEQENEFGGGAET